MPSTELLIVGCGPAGATAAREAARAGIETLVLERDEVVGSKRVCAAGLRPGFCETFDLPRSIVHCDTPRLALFDAAGSEHELAFGPGHTSTREELDGTMADLALREGAEIRTRALFRTIRRESDGVVAEYADLKTGQRVSVKARFIFLATGATARLDAQSFGRLAMAHWPSGLMTTLQYRVYLDRPAAEIAYRTLELHYYVGGDGRPVIGWMFPNRDHLAIGLGLMGKIGGTMLRAELASFVQRVRARLYSDAGVTAVRCEGHLLYGGLPRPAVADDGMMVGGTAAGFVDATNGEGIFEAALSGRFAADAVNVERTNAQRASERYASLIAARFRKRLQHRVHLMRYLEHRPQRYAVLFALLARTPRLAAVLLKEDCERTMSDRFYLYLQALGFGARSLLCHG
ncbi:MAG: NAD(P)/FAD-dependent oxidoreductase [Candidatus Eremiobacteraeota bacterium]|nr:NAD(P)/FAD-dependent oxidoreductase [Candidatus Eremiobacteraeota bacterium]